jgi:hypothetical protein
MLSLACFVISSENVVIDIVKVCLMCRKDVGKMWKKLQKQ